MPRSSSLHTVYCTPLHSPRPSLISTGSLGRHCSPSDAYRDYGGTLKHVKSGRYNNIILCDVINVEWSLKTKIYRLKTYVLKVRPCFQHHIIIQVSGWICRGLLINHVIRVTKVCLLNLTLWTLSLSIPVPGFLKGNTEVIIYEITICYEVYILPYHPIHWIALILSIVIWTLWMSY